MSVPLNEEKKDGKESMDLSAESMRVTRDTLSRITNELESASSSVDKLKSSHMDASKELLHEFVSKSLALMFEYNEKLRPIERHLNELSKPLESVLKNKLISIPCPTLESITLSRNPHSKNWGKMPTQYTYGKDKGLVKSKFSYFDLGLPKKAEEKSPKPADKGDSMAVDKDDTGDSGDTGDGVETGDTDKDGDSVMALEAVEMKENPFKPSMDNEPIPITVEHVDLVMTQVNGRRNREKAERRAIEQRQQAQLMALQKAQQRQGGAESIIGVIPWLTLDQAVALMEMKDDNLQQAINDCMASDPTAIYLSINEFMQQKSMKEQEAAAARLQREQRMSATASPALGSMKGPSPLPPLETRHFADKRVLVRSQSTGNVKSVIFRVIEVCSDGSVILRGVLDRNKIPLNPQYARILTLSATELQTIDFDFVDESIVNALIKENVLKIVFQIMKIPDGNEALQGQIMAAAQQSGFGQIQQSMAAALAAAAAAQGGGGGGAGGGAARRNGQKNTEYVPISITPQVREVAYKLDFGHMDVPSNACLKGVSHRIDGPVLFEGTYDNGTFSGMTGNSHENAIEIWSEKMDDHTHNLVMILMNDLRDDVAIDVKNLTGTGITREEACKDTSFGVDAMGRKLSYRILVDSGNVVAVLIPFASGVKEMPFVEHKVSPIGTLVKIDNSMDGKIKYGFIRSIPTGLIVTNDPKDDFIPIESTFSRMNAGPLTRKHLARLHGFIDIEIVNVSGDWILESTLKEAHNVVNLSPADVDMQSEFILVKESLKADVCADLEGILDGIDSTIKEIAGKDRDKAKELLGNANEMFVQAKKMKGELERKGDPSLKDTLVASARRMVAMERELRALRMEVNMR